MSIPGRKDSDFFNEENFFSPIFMHTQNEISFFSLYGDMKSNRAPENNYNYLSLNDFTPIKESEKENFLELNQEIYDENKPKISLEEEQEQELNFQNYEQIEKDKDFNSKIISKEEKSQAKIAFSTRPTSDKKEPIKIDKKIKFHSENKSLPSQWRFDMVKKHWKSKISHYSNNEINYYIRESDLPLELKQIIIHKPNSKLFTAKVNASENSKFLKNSLKEIFTMGKEKDNLQKQIEENINKIYKYFKSVVRLNNSLKRIKDFFDMNYEELIKKFYDSYEFNNFREDIKTKFYDEGTKRQEGFSLLENYGLINLFKMTNKKRKRD